MDCSVTYSKVKASNSGSGVTPGKGRYSSTVLTSRAVAATSKTTSSVKKSSLYTKYDANSDDSHERWIDQLRERYNEADKKSETLIDSVFGKNKVTKPSITLKTSGSSSMEVFNNVVNERIKNNVEDVVKKRIESQKRREQAIQAEIAARTAAKIEEIDAAMEKMSLTAFEKYLCNKLESGKITPEIYKQIIDDLKGKKANKSSVSVGQSDRTDVIDISCTPQEIMEIFNDIGIKTTTPEGTDAIIRPLGDGYEILQDESGTIVIKLKNGSKGVVYRNGNAIGSVSNIYMSSDGVDVIGSMAIDGRNVDVRVVADKTNWGEVFSEIGVEVSSSIDSAISTGADAVIELGKATKQAGEYLLDSYLIEKAKFDSKVADIIGDTLEFVGVEGRKRSCRRSKAKDGKHNKSNCI